MKNLLRLSVILLFCACFAACGEGSNSSTLSSGSAVPTPTPTRTPLTAPINAGALLPPAGTNYLGAYVNTSGLNGGNTPKDTALLESQIGRTLALHMYYQAWATNWGNRSAADDFNNGRVPIDSWNCGAPDAVVAATPNPSPSPFATPDPYDAEITLKAQEVKAYAWPVFIRFFWDMNTPDNNLTRQGCYGQLTDLPHGYFSGKNFVAAWIKIHDIFEQVGATNAVFVWSVNSQGVNPLNPDQSVDENYYPGDKYVDWVGIDAYDTNNGSFSQTFQSTYNNLATLHKPIMITETGALPGQQTSFFQEAVPAMQSQFPLVRGLVYYDSIYYDSPGFNQNQDWRITSNALPAFSGFANSRLMQGMYVF